MMGRQAHRCHSRVMHGGNPGAHQQTATHDVTRGYARAADYPQGNEGREDCGQKEKHHGGQVVINPHRQAESEHAGVVHRPDAGPHRRGAADQPRQPGLISGRGNASGKVECGIRRKDGNDYRE